MTVVQPSETNLCDFKTMTERLPGFNHATQYMEQVQSRHSSPIHLLRAGTYLVVPVISRHGCQLQLQTGHLGHQLQLLGLQSSPVEQLLWRGYILEYQPYLNAGTVVTSHPLTTCECAALPFRWSTDLLNIQFCWLQDIRLEAKQFNVKMLQFTKIAGCT